MAVVPLPQTQDFLNRSFIDSRQNMDTIVTSLNRIYSGSGSTTGVRGGFSSGEGSSAEGVSNAVLNVVEVEPNNTRFAPQYLNFGASGSKSNIVNITGNARVLGDTDFYSFDLNKGDIIDARLNSTALTTRVLALYSPTGQELMLATGDNLLAAPNSTTPRFTDGAVNLTYVVDAPGRYQLRVGDQIGSYALNLRGYRPRSEATPVGTIPILLLDFDGGLFNPQLINAPLNVGRLTPISNELGTIGLTAADTPRVIDEITNRVQVKFNRVGTTGTNGYFFGTGNPGDFSVWVTNTKDHPELIGVPGVTRILVGANDATDFGFPAGVLGVAQSVDVGNFDLSENAIVLVGQTLIDAAAGPISGTSTALQLFAELTAMVIAHEAGHTYGGVHQDPTNNVFGIMDQFYDPVISGGFGIDGIFGNADDTPLQFTKDAFAPTLGMIFGGGVSDTIANMAFGLSTSNQASFVSGTVYNDRNRNGGLNSGEEGLAGRLVFADYNANGILDVTEPRVSTAADGRFRLTLQPGTWRIGSVPATNWQVTSTGFQTITVGLGQTVTNINLGQFLPNQTVTGFKWADFNGNGIRETGEPGLAGVYIYVDLDGDNRIDIGEPSAITNADGSYVLTPPVSGIYAVREVVAPGFVQTFPGGSTASADQQEHTVNFSLGVPLRGLDFGNQPARDFGDAPFPYLTTIAQGGASAGFNAGLKLGANIDFEQDGLISSDAMGDDMSGLSANGIVVDDEDGVIFIRPIVRGDTQNVFRVSVTNTLGAASYLSAWVDWNQDGDWADAGEKVISDITGLFGSNDLRFTSPAGAALGNTFVRFRLSGKPGVPSAGFTEVGEVEDYRINVASSLDYAINDTFTVARSSTNNILDVQANDFVTSVPGQSATITRIGRVDSTQSSTTSITTATGAVVTISGQNILYTPRAGFQGVDSFTYTVITSSGITDSATVVVNTVFQRVNPEAIDDSFDIATDTVAFPLNVLANDLQGQGGALRIIGFTQPIRVGSTGVSAGTISLGDGSLSLRYTSAAGFGGTGSFTYTVEDGNGQRSTANVIVHTLEGDRLDDQVEFSFRFTDLAGTPVTAVSQGQQFKVEIFVDDLRAAGGFQQGVSSAFLDLLYNAGLTRPQPGVPGSGFDFAVDFMPPYNGASTGSNEFPGLISSLGGTAFVPIDTPNAVPVAILTFDAINSGIAEFVGDPANDSPNTDVVFYRGGPGAAFATTVPIEQVRYRRASLSILPVGTVLPVAVDDGQFARIEPNSIRNEIRVLANDIVGTNRVPSTANPNVLVGPEIRITNVGQGQLGRVVLDDRGNTNPADDVLVYTPNPTTNPNFTGTDQFTYTITDVAGVSSTGTVTLQIGNQANNTDAKAELRLEVTNLSGTPISQIPVGGQFQLRGYVRDLRPANAVRGVFAAYQDVLFDRNLASVNLGAAPLNFAVNFPTTYDQAVSGNTRLPGMIDEIGSTARGNTPLGSSERLQFTVTLTANAAGQLNFIGDPADVKPFHDSLLFEPQNIAVVPLLPSEIRYVRTSITIGSVANGEGFTNNSNRFDVNNDGFTSPIDVLIIINTLNDQGIRRLASAGAGEGEQSVRMFIDVNGDGVVSPIDALQIINLLNARLATSEGEGESPVATPIAQSVESQPEDTGLDGIVDALANDIVKRRRV